MSTIEQMNNRSKSFTTLSGAEYQLSRPWIGFWKKFNKFQEVAAKLEELAVNGGQVPDEFLDAYTEFILMWTLRLQPDVTKEDIENDFDIADIEPLMVIVNAYYTEVQTVSPPDSGAAATKGSRRRI